MQIPPKKLQKYVFKSFLQEEEYGFYTSYTYGLLLITYLKLTDQEKRDFLHLLDETEWDQVDKIVEAKVTTQDLSALSKGLYNALVEVVTVSERADE